MILEDMLDVDLLIKHVKNGIVSKQHHPRFPDLAIVNYTQDCVFSHTWDDVTLQCRGLIFNNSTGDVIARPFKKFWSKEQIERNPEFGPIPWEWPHRIFDKADGSLGIGYLCPDGSKAIATRGSFTSDQALHATEILNTKYSHITLSRWSTAMLEIVYPNNRIVLDYNGLDDLIYLGAVDIDTGADILPVGSVWDHYIQEYAFTESERKNKEGYVLFWPHNGFRLKVKHEEYLRLHRLIFGANTKTIWRELAEGRDPLKMGDLPDEFMPAIESLVQKFRDDFWDIESRMIRVWRVTMPLHSNRKEVAKALEENGDRTIMACVFRLLDGKSYDDIIWKALAPERAEPIW